jgi:hypothetical protein
MLMEEVPASNTDPYGGTRPSPNSTSQPSFSPSASGYATADVSRLAIKSVKRSP